MRKSKDVLIAGTGVGRGRRWAATLAFGAASVAAGPASAMQFNLGPEASLTWTTTLGYTAAYRVESQDDEVLADPNADDGDRAFNTGLIQSELSALTELELTYKNFGAFIRADTFFNQPYNHHSDNHSAATDNTPSNPPYEFVSKTEDVNRDDTRLLDAFVYGNFDIGGTRLNMRVGRQVISWGESLFLGGISAAQNPIDVTESHKPAAEVKKLLLPQSTALGQWQLTRNLSVAGYYQWDWEEPRLDGSGSYFSTADYFEGGEVLYQPNRQGPGLVQVPRGGTRTPDDESQYGFNMHYTVPALAYTDFGAYYVRYHSKVPQLVFGNGHYYAKYFEDIDLYGLSFTTNLFRYIQLGGELTRREGRPVLATPEAVPERGKTVQAQMHTITNLPWDVLGAGSTTVSAEVGVNKITSHDQDELTYGDSAARYAASVDFSYPNIAPLLDMTVTPKISHGFHNRSSARPVAFNNGNLQLGLGVSFDYGAAWSFSLNYTNFRGQPDDNKLTDRDFVSADINYTF